MSNFRFFKQAVAYLCLTSALSVNYVFAAPPQVQTEVIVGTLAGTGVAGNLNGPRLSSTFGLVSHPAIIPPTNPTNVGDILVSDWSFSDIKLIENTYTGSVSTYVSPPLFRPEGIVYDPFGYLWVADRYNRSIRRIDPINNAPSLNILLAAGQGTSTPSLNDPGAVDGPGDTATFNAPFGIASDANGQIYVSVGWGVENTSAGHSVIRKLSYDYTQDLSALTAPDITVSTVAGIAGVFGSADGALGVSTSINPTGLSFSKDYSTLYFVDGTGKLRALDPATNIVTTITTLPTNSLFIDIATGSDDSLYLTDGDRHVIWRYADGTLTQYAGILGSSGFVDGPASTAQFNTPYGMVLDENDNIYLADAGNFAVRALINKPDFSEFVDLNDCRVSDIAAGLNDTVEEIFESGDIFGNTTLAGLQSIALLTPTEQYSALLDMYMMPRPIHFPGMLVTTEFGSNKIFDLEAFRSKTVFGNTSKYRPANWQQTGEGVIAVKKDAGGVWIEPMFANLKRKSTCCTPRLHNKSQGIIGGIDYGFERGGVFGLAAGLLTHDIDYDGSVDKEKIISPFVSPYMSLVFGNKNGQLDLAGLFAKNRNKMHKESLATGMVADGRDKGHTLAAKLHASYHLVNTKSFQFGPYGGIAYNHLKNGKYVETLSDGSLNLSVNPHYSALLRKEVGLSNNLRLEASDTVFNLNSKVGYVHAHQTRGNEVMVHSNTYGDFVMNAQEVGKKLGTVGINFDYLIVPGASITASYAGEFSKRYYGYGYAAGLKIQL